MLKQNKLLIGLVACLTITLLSCNSNVGNTSATKTAATSGGNSTTVLLRDVLKPVDGDSSISSKSQATATVSNLINVVVNNNVSLSAIQLRFYSDNLCGYAMPFTMDLTDKGSSSNAEALLANKTYAIQPTVISTLCGSNYFGECSNVVSKAKALRAVYYTTTGKILYGACSTAAPQAAQSSSSPVPMESNIFNVGGTGATACNASTGSNCLMQKGYTDYLGTDYQDFLMYGGDIGNGKFADCYINFLNGQINNCFTASFPELTFQILSFSNVIYNNRYLYSGDSRAHKSIVQVNFNGDYGFYDYQNSTTINISSLLNWSPNDVWAIAIYNNYLYLSVTSNGTYNLVRCTLDPYYGLKSSSQCSLLSLNGISSGYRYADLYVDGSYLVAASGNCLYYASINSDGTLSNPGSKCYSALPDQISNMGIVSNGNGGLYYYLSPVGFQSYMYSVTETTAGNPTTLSSSLNTASNLPSSMNSTNVGTHGVQVAAANNYAYYALYNNLGNNIYSCPRNASTGIISSTCNNTTPWSSWDYIQEMHYLHTPTSNSPLYAFITTRTIDSINAAVERCQVDPITGLAVASTCSYLYGSSATSNGGVTLGVGENGVVYNGYFYTGDGNGVLWKIPVNDSSNAPVSATAAPVNTGISGLMIYNNNLYAANNFAHNDTLSILGESVVNNSFPVSTSSLSTYVDSTPPTTAKLNYISPMTNPNSNNYIYFAATDPSTNGVPNILVACQISSTTAGKITASTCQQVALPNNDSAYIVGATSMYNDKLYISYVEKTSNTQKSYVCNTTSNTTLSNCLAITEKTTTFTNYAFSNITVNQGYLYLVDNSNSIIWRCVLNSNSNVVANSCVNFFTNFGSNPTQAYNAMNITFSQAY